MSLNQSLALISTINATINEKVIPLFTVDIYFRINQEQRKTMIIQVQHLFSFLTLISDFTLTA
jgi:hypothetical protein